MQPKHDCDPIEAQKCTPLVAVVPAEIAACCQRIAVGNGLPLDGHVVHTALQGQALCYGAGSSRELKTEAVAGSESDWDVAGSLLPFICEGDSAAGKDNVKRVLLKWVAALDKHGFHATNVMKQGSITTKGILDALLAGNSQLQVINGELEKVLNKAKDKFLQEADMIELNDGSDAFGRGVSGTNLCMSPAFWCFLSTQMRV